MPGSDRSRRFPWLAWAGAAWIALLVITALLAPVLPLRDPSAKGIRTGEVGRFESPGWNAWFGGARQGEDQLARVVAGIRPALVLGLVVTLLGALLGGVLGVAAGYLRGRLDRLAVGFIDAALAFPVLVLVIAARAAFGASLVVIIAIFTAASIAPYARLVRGATLTLAERDFVVAARAMGATRRRILWRELAPNLALPLFSFACLGFAVVILTEGGLSFLGLSVHELTWGQLIAEGAGEIRHHPHVALIPATVMFLTVMAFNLVGDGLGQLGGRRRPVTVQRQRTGPPSPDAPGPLPAPLSIRNLSTVLHTATGDVMAVDDVSLEVAAAEVVGLVGESGSGKTMILRSIVGAFPVADVSRNGSVEVDGVDVLRGRAEDVQRTLGTAVGMISQNPLTALNPVRRIEHQLTEPMTVHGGLTRAAARRRALELLDQVGLTDGARRLRSYPHELSGGMRQRVTIAVALANHPSLLLADEPTTALDVTIQEQIVTLLARLQDERTMAMVFVTHDLALLGEIADTICVVYGGQIVERAPAAELFRHPRHRYTVALLASRPDPAAPSHTPLAVIPGHPPVPRPDDRGCRFAPRCPAATAQCREERPPEVVDGTHHVRCWHPRGDDEPA